MMASLLNPSCFSVSSSSKSHQRQDHKKQHAREVAGVLKNGSNGGETARWIENRRHLLIGLAGLFSDSHLSSICEKAAIAATLQPELELQVGYRHGKFDMSWNPAAAAAAPISEEFPRTLDSVIKTRVQRGKKSRSQKEKEEEEEVLVIDRIQLPREAAVKFDVYLNLEDERLPGPQSAEFVGSFVNVPQKRMRSTNPTRLSTCLRLGITDSIDDLGADADEDLEVTLVPRLGTDTVTIGGIKIEYLS